MIKSDPLKSSKVVKFWHRISISMVVYKCLEVKIHTIVVIALIKNEITLEKILKNSKIIF